MQLTEILVLKSNKDYDHLTFIKHFLGGNDSVGDINEDFHKKHCSECSNIACLQSTL